MQKMILLPALALAGGFGGFLLRSWELSTAFEATGLAVPWAPATTALVVLSLLMAAVFIFLCRKPRCAPKGYDDAFAVPNYGLYLPVSAAACLCLLLAGLLGLRGELSGGTRGLLWLLLWVLCLVSFVCVLLAALASLRGRSKRPGILLLAPAYTLCVWLVAAYQKWAADPVVVNYMYELIAIICALLAFYFTAGFAFSRVKVRTCSVFCLLSVYFGIITLADDHGTGQRLLVLFCILYQLATAGVLLYNAFTVKPRRLLRNERMPGRAENETGEGTPAE